jgi:hypothetical protein
LAYKIFLKKIAFFWEGIPAFPLVSLDFLLIEPTEKRGEKMRELDTCD